MARHRKRAHKKHHRRRMSGIGAALSPKSPVVMIAAVAAGYFLADTINTQTDKLLPTSMAPSSTGAAGWVAPAAKIGLGALLLLGKKPSLIKAIPGGILAGAGLKQALVKTGVVTGYQSVPVIGRHMAGYQSVPVIGKMPAQLTGYRVNGMPGQLTGYRVNGDTKVMGSIGSTVPGSDYMG